jgi:hypothetical protein
MASGEAGRARVKYHAPTTVGMLRPSGPVPCAATPPMRKASRTLRSGRASDAEDLRHEVWSLL